MTGGLGNDVFAYINAAHSTSAAQDGIHDFALGDLIDLSVIDADTGLGGNQAFGFIGNAAFGGHAGELRFQNVSAGGAIWIVQGDTDGNGASDFEVVVVLADAHPLTGADFVL
jgi:serralysin